MLGRSNIELVAAFGAAICAGGDVAAGRNGICHESTVSARRAASNTCSGHAVSRLDRG
jgi:methylaspartate ammonia-lyase